MNLNRQNGFTLVTFLVAQALLGVTVLATMRFLSGAGRASRGVASKIDVEQMRSLTAQVLSRPDFCTQAFRGLHFSDFGMSAQTPPNNTVQLANITVADPNGVGDGLVLAQVGQVFTGNAKIDSLTMGNFRAVVQGGATYLADVSFHISAPNLVGGSKFQAKLPLMLETQAGTTPTDREIVSCGSTTSNPPPEPSPSPPPPSSGFTCANIIGGVVDQATGNCRVLIENRPSDPPSDELKLGQVWIRSDI